MRVPIISRVLVIIHTIIALFIFGSVWLNAGGYQNGLQWGIVTVVDYPVFLPWGYFVEDRMFNPALVPELTLNWIILGYTLLFGTLYWFTIGWTISWIHRKLKRHGS